MANSILAKLQLVEGSVPEHLADVHFRNPFYEFNRQEFMLRLNSRALAVYRHGVGVTVDAALMKASLPHWVRTALFSACAYFSGCLPVRAVAAARGQHSFLVAGELDWDVRAIAAGLVGDGILVSDSQVALECESSPVCYTNGEPLRLARAGQLGPQASLLKLETSPTDILFAPRLAEAGQQEVKASLEACSAATGMVELTKACLLPEMGRYLWGDEQFFQRRVAIAGQVKSYRFGSESMPAKDAVLEIRRWISA